MISTHQSAGSQGKQPLRMVVGSGYKVDGRKNGCVLLYSADAPSGPWQYQGAIAAGNFDHGRVWECPALAQVRNRPDVYTLTIGDWGESRSVECHTVKFWPHSMRSCTWY